MDYRNTCIRFFLMNTLSLIHFFGIGQQVENVPKAFKALETEPEIILIDNTLKVPTEEGHFQGVQVVENDRTEKLLVSGSSSTTAYILQLDLATRKTDKLIALMKAPFRHAGGIQVSEPYVIVGIEDNFTKTVSKVRVYSYLDTNLYKARPNMSIDRRGEPKRQTAGATGLLRTDTGYLAVVANWDSRNWDFYYIHPEKQERKLLESFAAPHDWPSYQSINLIKDDQSIYAIGFYQKEATGYADLILVSKLEKFESISERICTKSFQCKNGVDFSTAAGLQVDQEGKLHIWATQRNAQKQITVNRFSPK